jgi:hypothetical protein
MAKYAADILTWRISNAPFFQLATPGTEAVGRDLIMPETPKQPPTNGAMLLKQKKLEACSEMEAICPPLTALSSPKIQGWS